MRTRRGMTLLIAMIALAVMSILGISVHSFAVSRYAQTSKMAAELKARELAMAALEEARGAVYAQVQQAGADTPWRTKILEECRKKADDGKGAAPKPVDLDASWDLVTAGLLPGTVEAARLAGGSIVSAKVDFIGFRRIGYAADTTWLKENFYYRDPRKKLDTVDAEDPYAPHDYIGYYRLRVEAAWAGATRRLSSIHDVKVVSTAPMARQFALFSWMAARRAESDKQYKFAPADPDHWKKDLRSGGAFRVHAKGQGRAFVRGPLLVDTEGWNGTQPNKGQRPEPTLSHAAVGGYGDRETTWWGWSTVPMPRAGVVRRTGAIITIEADQKRPWMRSRDLDPLQYNIEKTVGWTGGDAGFAMLDPDWFFHVETTQPGEGGGFSLVGDPTRGCFEGFRGHVIRRQLSAGNQPEERVYASDSPGLPQIARPDGRVNPQALADAPVTDDDDENTQWSLECEGALYTATHAAKYHFEEKEGLFGIALGAEYSVQVDTATEKLSRYGLHWEPERVEGFIGRLLKDLSKAGKLLFQLEGLGVIDLDLLADAATGALSELGEAVMAGANLADAFGNEVDGGGPSGSVDADGEGAPQAAPPGFRPLGRAVTRRYAKLADIPALVRGESIALDGILGVKDLTWTEPFTYTGRGVLYTAGAAAKLPGLITPGAQPEGTAPSLLSIYVDGSVKDIDSGEQMLELTGGPEDATVVASVYSTQGVRSGGKVAIAGNLVCGLINKSKIDPNGGVTVHYATDALTKPEKKSWHDGRWHVVAVSHRVCQSVEW